MIANCFITAVSGLAAKGAAVELFNMDCMELMAKYPDKHFDLAIVDPPYGVGDWQTVRDPDKHNLRAQKKYGKVDWNDATPTQEYFTELKRVSKEQIIWGANYYNQFSPSGGAIVWDKKNDENRYSDGDIASCSLQKKISFFRHRWNGFLQENMANKEVRIHSCQKPVQLYKWCLQNYAKEGWKILDTHLGSGSIAIAVDSVNKIEKLNLSFVGCEISEEYFNKAMKRFTDETKQNVLF